MKVEVWSDFVCPFCYIGKRRLENALEQFPHKDQVEVEFKSFQLDPNTPAYTEKHIYEALAAKYGSTIEQMEEMNKGLIQQAAEVGLTYNYDDMKPTNTFDAHRLTKFAKTVGKEAELTEKLLHAYFTESKNVGDIDTLADIAATVGIEKEKALEVLNDKSAYSQDVKADESMARQIGVTGVPFFVINNKYAISGAQPLETFAGALQKVWDEENPKPMFEDLSSENGAVCTDDSCAVPDRKE
ncbi:DsbA family oxidoreductase [Radiobacillus kanasensis]|uniref:DsbA family oxidoreductase n=1 Tax=Radiobacillus kanasensis TaxID=2844358 RepID=UPI001E3C311B|nr:DsbA family oxidoreductase [Radiobacillus kanasensis]UFU00626.1 DsbA family oxidoreductase [Radiobacillus kanasensis]